MAPDQIDDTDLIHMPDISKNIRNLAGRAGFGNGRDGIAHRLSHARLGRRPETPGTGSACGGGRSPGAAWVKRSVSGTKRHRRPRPRPHTPFTTRALSIPTDAAPPPNGSPFNGKIMNHDVSQTSSSAVAVRPP